MTVESDEERDLLYKIATHIAENPPADSTWVPKAMYLLGLATAVYEQTKARREFEKGSP